MDWLWIKMIYGLCVTKNEANRQLRQVIRSMSEQVDKIMIFDDQSTDNTVNLLDGFPKVTVKIRDNNTPSFLEDEGGFRKAAWSMLDDVKENEGVIVFDADELYVSKVNLHFDATLNESKVFRWALQGCLENGCDGVEYKYNEVFDIGNDFSYGVRTDGFWGDIWAKRFCLYKGPGEYKSGMACGSLPTYVKNIHRSGSTDILHFGYATQEDREAKYQRYSSMQHNHNQQHINSILEKPTLKWI